MNNEKRLAFLIKYHYSLTVQLQSINNASGTDLLNNQLSKAEAEIESLLFCSENSIPKDKQPATINTLVHEAHQYAIDKGWYEEPKSFGESIALMHSELSEALEDHRNGHGFREIYYEGEKPCGIPTELADTVIRISDTCGYLGIDLEAAIKQKMAYNATRPHRHGGKKL